MIGTAYSFLVVFSIIRLLPLQFIEKKQRKWLAMNYNILWTKENDAKKVELMWFFLSKFGIVMNA